METKRPRFGPWAVFGLIIPFQLWSVQRLDADCPGLGPGIPLPNVTWSLRDSVIGCPAADSVAFSPPSNRPTRLRIFVTYTNECLTPHPSVPPESVWVTTAVVSGNPKVNSQPGKVFADDSTNSFGQTRITIPSLSGCGRLKVSLFVSGVAKGFKTVQIRSTDRNADGRVTSADYGQTECNDLNFNGQVGLEDEAVLSSSIDHWFRHAMFGTPVRRTNLVEYQYGSGGIAWSPDGSKIAFSSHTGPNGECQIQIVGSAPSTGDDSPVPFSFPPTLGLDYNPSWSPRNNEISFDRNDRQIYRKGLQGQPDTSEVLVVASGINDRVTEGAISPDGRTIAYTKLIPGSSAHIYSIPITGGTSTQLTSGSGISDRRPQWSPDGAWIYFGRLDNATQTMKSYRVPAAGGTTEFVYGPLLVQAKYPTQSPDGLVTVVHAGPNYDPRVPKTVETAMSGNANPPAIVAYANQPSFEGYPAVAPDGTRLAYIGDDPSGVSQLWATRMNMDKPPVLSSIGDKVIEQGLNLSFTISASDLENDPLTYASYYLRSDLGMSFNPTTKQFSWTPPPSSLGQSYFLKFMVSEPSGGTDGEVIKISVIQPGLRAMDLQSTEQVVSLSAPVRRPSGGFSIGTSAGLGLVTMNIYSVSGQLVTRVRGKAGTELIWDAVGQSGGRVRSGLYFYSVRVEGSPTSKVGRWVLIP